MAKDLQWRVLSEKEKAEVDLVSRGGGSSKYGSVYSEIIDSVKSGGCVVVNLRNGQTIHSLRCMIYAEGNKSNTKLRVRTLKDKSGVAVFLNTDEVVS